MLAIDLTKAVRKDPEYKLLHSVADGLRGRVRRNYLEALNRIKSRAKLKELAEAIEQGGADIVIRSFGLQANDPKTYEELVNSIRTVFEKAGQASLEYLPENVSVNLRFDLLNPNSVRFLRQYELDLITSINNNTREGIRTLLLDSFEQGIAPRETARKLREMVGLTKRQTKAVLNYEKMLIEEGRDKAQIKRMVDRYTKRQLKLRAENIARTETIRAASAGQNALWRQAVEEGLIDADKARRQWIVTPDDRLCPICREIPGNNEGGIPLGRAFETSVGPVEFPPAHPRCRCATGLVEF